MINRAAILLRLKAPAIAWVNAYVPAEDGSEITLEDANREGTVYLVALEDTETWDMVEEWVILNYRDLFEAELEEWSTDPALWPDDRSYRVFQEWFDVECHTVILDTVGTEIYDEDELLPPGHLDA